MSGTKHQKKFSRLDWRTESKRLFRKGVAKFDLEYSDVAAACDENISTVKAWAAKDRDHSVPEWAMVRLRQTYPALAAYIDERMEQFGGSASTGDAEAATIDAIGSNCRSGAKLAAALPGGISQREASDALPDLYDDLAKTKRAIQIYERIAGLATDHSNDDAEEPSSGVPNAPSSTPVAQIGGRR